MDGDSLQVSKPGGNPLPLSRNSGGTVLHCSRALTGLVTKGFVIALPTFHAFFITHWCRLPQHGWIARFPLLGRVCAYHYYTECAHSIGIRVNSGLINLSLHPRKEDMILFCSFIGHECREQPKSSSDFLLTSTVFALPFLLSSLQYES